MQPVFENFKKSFPLVLASLIATVSFSYIIRKVFFFALAESVAQRWVFSIIATFFFVSISSFLFKMSGLQKEVARFT